MRAVTWPGKRDVRVDTVPDPKIEGPADVVVRSTATGIRGSDRHVHEVLGPFHRLPLGSAPEAYRTLQHKVDGMVTTLPRRGGVA